MHGAQVMCCVIRVTWLAQVTLSGDGLAQVTPMQLFLGMLCFALSSDHLFYMSCLLVLALFALLSVLLAHLVLHVLVCLL